MENILVNNMVSNFFESIVNSTKSTGCRFGSITYTNEQGGKSLYNLIFGINIVSAYKSDLRKLTALLPTLTGIDAVACQELIDSINNSLTKGIGNNDNYTLKGYFEPLTPNGEVKKHVDETGVTSLYIRGYVIHKTEIIPGVYKKVNSSPKTLAKQKIEKTLKRGNFRTFKINVNVLKSVKVNGLTIEIE